jgi:two-component system, NtrC family, response regulator AtoC
LLRSQSNAKALDEILAGLREIEANIQPRTRPKVSLDDHEKNLLAGALKRAGGNQSEAARMLGISRDRLRYKISKHKLPR